MRSSGRARRVLGWKLGERLGRTGTEVTEGGKEGRKEGRKEKFVYKTRSMVSEDIR